MPRIPVQGSRDRGIQKLSGRQATWTANMQIQWCLTKWEGSWGGGRQLSSYHQSPASVYSISYIYKDIHINTHTQKVNMIFKNHFLLFHHFYQQPKAFLFDRYLILLKKNIIKRWTKIYMFFFRSIYHSIFFPNVLLVKSVCYFYFGNQGCSWVISHQHLEEMYFLHKVSECVLPKAMFPNGNIHLF